MTMDCKIARRSVSRSLFHETKFNSEKSHVGSNLIRRLELAPVVTDISRLHESPRRPLNGVSVNGRPYRALR